MIFVDTSYWYALRVPSDRSHSQARLLWGRRSRPILTSNAVVAETWTLMNNRLGHHRAVEFVDSVVQAETVGVHRVDERVETTAWDWLRRHDERPYSFVDATSFALMRSLGISEAFAFDGDFAAAGFTELRV